MSERKNIDRLFQEKFKDFEAVPPKNMWGNIQAELDGEKKKRKFIAPFWLRLSGIAAVFLLGFLTATYFLSNPGKPQNSPVVNSDESNKNANGSETGNKQNSLIDRDHQINTTAEEALVEENTAKNSIVNRNNTNTIVNRSHTENNNYSAKKGSSNRVIANRKNRTKKQSGNYIAGNNKNGFYATDFDKRLTDKENDNDGSSKNSGKTRPFNFHKKNNIANYIIIPEKDSTQTETAAETENVLDKVQKEKLLAETKKIKEKEVKKSKWAISSTVTPIFFRSTSNGSPIDNQFASNTKDYENTMSYGLGLRYELNDKLTLRTGINRLAFEYNTNNIVYYESANANGLQNISRNNSGANIQIQNKNGGLTTDPNSGIVEKMNSGTLNQKMGYIEVPMELSYKLIDNRFGIELIGGFSTLFLNQNKIDLVSSELNTTIGEANNLNDVHLSSNIGVGVKYRFLKSFEANFEPTFKYQLNMFSSDAGNFKPYLFGLYTGVSYRF